MKTYIVLLHMFWYYKKHPYDGNKICRLPSSCFQHHLHDWFYVLRNMSYLSRLEWTLPVFNFDYIRDLTHRCKSFPFSVAEYASFSHQGRTPKTNLQGLISNFPEYYFKIGTICRLYLSSHVFTALGFDSNHFGTLLWKIVPKWP